MSSYQPNPSGSLRKGEAAPVRPLDEQHAVETPEQIRLQFRVAGIGSRFLAIAIDSVIQIAMAIALGVLFAVLGFSFGGRLGRSAGLWSMAGLIAVYFALYFGYFVLFEISWNGQTPGKRTIGIRVIKDSGRPLIAVEAIGRNLLRIVDQMPSFYMVGIITALCNSQSKRLGDFVAGSIVVQDKGIKESSRPWEAMPRQQESSAFLSVQSLSAQDMAIVQAFLGRRSELDLGTRQRIASEILERISERLSISLEQREQAEGTLELIESQYRQR